MILGFKTHPATADFKQSSKLLLKNAAIYNQKIRYSVRVIANSNYSFKMTKTIIIPGKSVTSKVLTSAWDS